MADISRIAFYTERPELLEKVRKTVEKYIKEYDKDIIDESTAEESSIAKPNVLNYTLFDTYHQTLIDYIEESLYDYGLYGLNYYYRKYDENGIYEDTDPECKFLGQYKFIIVKYIKVGEDIAPVRYDHFESFEPLVSHIKSYYRDIELKNEKDLCQLSIDLTIYHKGRRDNTITSIFVIDELIIKSDRFDGLFDKPFVGTPVYGEDELYKEEENSESI